VVGRSSVVASVEEGKIKPTRAKKTPVEANSLGDDFYKMDFS